MSDVTLSTRGGLVPRILPGQTVIVNLANPSEKYWGILGELGVAGVVLRGIGVASFDDWTAQAARRGEEPSLDLATMFFPLYRVERLFLDEPVGQVESYRQRFERRVGRSLEEFLGAGREDDGGAAN